MAVPPDINDLMLTLKWDCDSSFGFSELLYKPESREMAAAVKNRKKKIEKK